MSPCAVTFMIDPSLPVAGSDDAGGHAHDGDRPRGSFEQPGTKVTTATCTVSTFDAQGVGTCDVPVTYFPPNVGGNVTIVADTQDFGTDQKQVSVQVPGLVPLADSPSQYVLVGTPNNYAGTNDPCRPIPPSSNHFQNHFGQGELNADIGAIADRMSQSTPGVLLRVNDMSLPAGGLFDIGNNWSSSPGHVGHRVGVNADIGFTGIRNGVCVGYSRSRLQRAIQDITKRVPLIEGDHFHARIQ